MAGESGLVGGNNTPMPFAGLAESTGAIWLLGATIPSHRERRAVWAFLSRAGGLD